MPLLQAVILTIVRRMIPVDIQYHRFEQQRDKRRLKMTLKQPRYNRRRSRSYLVKSEGMSINIWALWQRRELSRGGAMVGPRQGFDFWWWIMKYSKLRCFAWLVRDNKDGHVTNITNTCRNSSWVACDDFNMVGFTFLVMGKSVASRDTLWNSSSPGLF